MTERDIELKLNDHNHEIESLKDRLDDCEEQQKTINDLVNSVNKLAINMEHMLEEQRRQGDRLATLEREPAEEAKYYKRIALACIITSIVSATAGALLSTIF